MDLFEDAIVSLLQCLALDTEVKAAKDYLSKVKIFSVHLQFDLIMVININV
jgi:hypothetical protein